MKATLKSRLIVLELAIVGVVVLLCYAGYQAISVSFRREAATAETLRKSMRDFAVYQVQYYEIANHLEAEIGSLNQALLRFFLENDPDSWAQFQRDSQRLAEWIRAQKATLPAGKTVDLVPALGIAVDFPSLLDEIEKSYARYLEGSHQIATALGKSAAPAQRLKALEAAMAESQKLLALAGRTRASGESFKLFALSKPIFPWQTAWIPAMLLALVVVCGWLAVHFYRRELREALEMRQQLTQSQLLIERQKKLAQKGQTAAELAHEIRNPLAAINFRLYTLQKELAGSPDEHRDTALIRKEIRRLNAILEDFLQLDQSTQPKFEMISAEAALREARELMAPQLAAQRIQVKLESDGNTDMSADPQLLQQVLINLIKNAAESIDGDGIITLRARKDTAELRRHQTDVVIIEVQDTGQGIPPEVQEQLFDPFFTTKKGGSGLGLSIVERIVEKHRGLLDFDTEIGKGSTFRVVLPVELDR